jgi:hypothetical protein
MNGGSLDPATVCEGPITMKRVTRDRRLTPEEAARYKTVREQIAGELPDLIARHHQRSAAFDQVNREIHN